MPAEKVYGQQTYAPPISMGEIEPRSQVPIVDVRWGRDQGYVQVVTKAEDAWGGRWAEGEGSHFTDGMYVNLDREAINRLIRNLRRARDQAFGRDE